MNTEEKSEAIIKAIISRCNNSSKDNAVVSFYPDWGGNSLTIEIQGLGHSHCGYPDASFEELVDHLYSLLCHNSGLSFVK